MTITKNRLFFKTAFITLDDKAIRPLYESGEYSSIIALSYEKMDIEGFVRTEKTTALIDTSVSEDEIYGRFSEREKIAKTYKTPELSFAVDDQNKQPVYRAYSDFEFSQGRAPISIEQFEQFRLFSAYLHGEPVSGINIIESAHYIRIRSIFSKRLTIGDKAMYRLIASSSRRVMWELCKWAHEHGYRSVDLASVNLVDQAKKGISDFKMSFGGTIVTEYTYTYKSRLFTSLEFLARFRVYIRKLIHSVFRR